MHGWLFGEKISAECEVALRSAQLKPPVMRTTLPSGKGLRVVVLCVVVCVVCVVGPGVLVSVLITMSPLQHSTENVRFKPRSQV